MSRIDKIKKFLSDNRQSILITNNENIYYFTSFYNSEGAVLITKDEVYLLVDFRYYEAACRCAENCVVVQFTSCIEELKKLLLKHNIQDLLIEAEHTNLNTYSKYVRVFNEIGVSVNYNGGLDRVISNLRLIKSKEEISFINNSQKITEKAYNEVLNYVKSGNTEKSIANELEYLLKKYGADDISFDLITITGKNTALPHGVPSENTICDGDFFTFDIGALYRGYHSDTTRTVAVKSYTEEMKKVYDIVYEAQTKALEMVKSGVKAFDVDKKARDIITSFGYGDCFGHSTGHGVGLNIHELPNVSPKSDSVLSDGMVITVEPGIYIENKFGVRIEDMVLVLENGYKNFVSLSKELIIV